MIIIIPKNDGQQVLRQLLSWISHSIDQTDLYIYRSDRSIDLSVLVLKASTQPEPDLFLPSSKACRAEKHLKHLEQQVDWLQFSFRITVHSS